MTPKQDALALQTRRLRRFLDMTDDEETELTFMVKGKIFIAHAHTDDDHVRLLREAERIQGFNGAYQLVNGPIDPQIFARYEPNKIDRAWNGRVADAQIQKLRAIFIDCDPIRLKGISATDDEKAAAAAVAKQVYTYLSTLVDPTALGRGDSGNGYFLLVALQPLVPTADTTAGIARFLADLSTRFSTDRVKIDTSVSNPARLMACPGTMKRKGWHTAERPHRRTSFSCAERVTRVQITLAAPSPPPEARPPARAQAPVPADGLYTRANKVPTTALLERLGFELEVTPRGTFATCPGCSEPGAKIGDAGLGLKCLHDRCSRSGVPSKPGFRTNADIVATVHGCSPSDAAKLICAWFGLDRRGAA